MKKVYFFAVALIATTSLFSQDSGDTLTFESYDLGTNDYYNGSDENGDIVINHFTLSNSYNSDWGSWSGFAISKVQDVTTPGYANEYASFANGGANGSAKYGVYYGGTIEFNTPRIVTSLQVTNTTYTALSMRDGDSFAKQFGSPNNAEGDPDGTNGEDWFLLQIIPLDENDNLAGDTVDFYLADYRFADNNDDYIVDTWETVTFNNVVAKKLTFLLSSSDNGSWGMNTPGYFAIDNLVASPTVGLNTLNQSNTRIYPNPANGQFVIDINENAQLELINAIGQIVRTETINGKTSIDINSLPEGLYHVSLKSDTGSYNQKLIIR